MSPHAKYRVTYEANQGPCKGYVTLSEIVEAADLEDAYHNVKDWAERQGWILKAVEEVTK